MDVWVTFQSPTGQQRHVQVTERSSDDATVRAATATFQRSWPDTAGWLPLHVVEWNPHCLP